MTTTDPKTLATEATTAYQEGDYENAARLFGEAASAFQEAGLALEAAEMQNNQSVAHLLGQDAQASYTAAHETAAVFQAAGDFRRAGMAFSNEATALEALGRPDEALPIYRLAAAELEKAGEDQLYMSVMQAQAGIFLRKGKLIEALLATRMGLMNLKQLSWQQKLMRALLKLIKV
jgi:tetratricopeptide (TPR) repeat protein